MIPLAVFLIALGVRLPYLVALGRTPFLAHPTLDPRLYDGWAQRIAAGEWLGREVFFANPLYPYWLGVLYAVFGRNLWLVHLLQHVLGSVAAALLAWLGMRLWDRRVGWMAGLGAAFYAPLRLSRGEPHDRIAGALSRHRRARARGDRGRAPDTRRVARRRNRRRHLRPRAAEPDAARFGGLGGHSRPPRARAGRPGPPRNDARASPRSRSGTGSSPAPSSRSPRTAARRSMSGTMPDRMATAPSPTSSTRGR